MNLGERIDMYGVRHSADQDLLELLLDDHHLARMLLDRFGEIASIGHASRVQLYRAGLTKSNVIKIHAIAALGRRIIAFTPQPLARFDRSADVARYFQARLAGLQHEELHLVLLDCRNRVFKIEMIAKGGLTGISIAPRDILLPAVHDGAAGIILVHNHPSGDATASQADRALTERVAEAAELLGIALLDHVVVARGGYVSLLQ